MHENPLQIRVLPIFRHLAVIDPTCPSPGHQFDATTFEVAFVRNNSTRGRGVCKREADRASTCGLRVMTST